VTASDDGTARVWDTRTGKPLTKPLVHHRTVSVVLGGPAMLHIATHGFYGFFASLPECSPSARRDLIVHKDDVVVGTTLVHLDDRFVHRLLDRQHTIAAVAFSPDGGRVVTASWDETARVWDARTGKPLTEPITHLDHVVAVAFSPDGERILTASGDCTARVWDARTGKPLTKPLRGQSAIIAAAFSPDGTRVVTASRDGATRAWELPLDNGSLDDWKRRARCGVFALEDGVLVDNHAPCP
jgi:WD40 repeat protein